LGNGDLAVVALCMDSSAGTFFNVVAPLAALGWTHQSTFVRDVYNHVNLNSAVKAGNLTLQVAPNTSSMVRLSRQSRF
jgi:hypothetical protein